MTMPSLPAGVVSDFGFSVIAAMVQVPVSIGADTTTGAIRCRARSATDKLQPATTRVLTSSRAAAHARSHSARTSGAGAGCGCADHNLVTFLQVALQHFNNLGNGVVG